MEVGLITVCKTLYRSQMFRFIMHDFEARQEHRDEIDSQQWIGINGIADACNPHMLDLPTSSSQVKIWRRMKHSFVAG